MSVPVFRRNNCRLCSGQDLELVMELAPTPVGAAFVSGQQLQNVQECYPIDLFLCRQCGHAQLLDVIDPEPLFAEAVEITSVSLGLVEHLGNLADRIESFTDLQKGSFIVEIGSNDGSLLKAFAAKGMRVLGVEPGRHVAQIANTAGIQTLPTFFSAELSQKIRKEHGPSNVITANRVFANIDDLHDVVEGVRNLLSDDGLFVIETGYLIDLLEHTLVDVIYHEHLSYESVRSLVPFFRNNGLELVNAERVPIKGGSLRVMVQHAGGPWPVSPSVAELIGLEESFGIDRAEPFKALANEVETSKQRLMRTLSELKSQGKTIAGYGAAVGATTLIYLYGVSDILSYLVDDDSTKWGLFSPGHHIPVLPPQIIYDRKPDYIVIFAWRYSGPIVEKHKEYLEQGGQFIVPLPEVEIIDKSGSKIISQL